MTILDLEALAEAPLHRDPCDFVIVPAFVKPEALAAVNDDYPDIREPGNFPPEALTYGPAFAGLLDELAGPALRDAFQRKFDMRFDDLVLQTTVRRFSESTDGNIHNDSRTKIVTVLIYFNESWPHAGGRLRLLRSPRDIDDFAAEVPPERGTMLAFRRSERSFHGFVPCEAERRSLQMYWVKPKRETRDARGPGSLIKRVKRLLKRG